MAEKHTYISNKKKPSSLDEHPSLFDLLASTQLLEGIGLLRTSLLCSRNRCARSCGLRDRRTGRVLGLGMGLLSFRRSVVVGGGSRGRVGAREDLLRGRDSFSSLVF